ncbi:hypothetical protein SAMN04488587_0433 [Methanococcoides vulcani]|uniref:DUF7308 domain-containing protein n=1 Tax=Methanococcoides vulcani TaxID=1353158 RepID=A0A1H9YCB9_9EURY|nr:hypothetical protein [Methanococcoides vulcani]SES66575.1 hypothetical protein SAMN04488587_0433 [Methanococcoides vulcani]
MGTKQRSFDSCKAVSSVVGLLLMYSLAIIAVGIILVYNVPVLNDMQDSAKAQKVEQAFTVMDSRISKVALGESPRQTTSVSLMGGEINVNSPGEAERGTMTIQLINTTTNMTEEFNCSLGTVEYVKDDRTVAYEGGGVWSDYGSKGGIVMVSPPEFHYNGKTLTLPIMTVNGNSSVTGNGNTAISVTSDNQPYILYPNTSLSVSRTNPTEHLDKVVVYIKSDYYKAWANYANSMTQTSATLDDENKTAIVSFTTQPPMGTQPLTNSLKVGQIDPEPEEPIHEFHYDFEAGDSTAKGLKSMNSELKVTSGTRTLTYEFQKREKPDRIDIHSVTYEDEDPAVGSSYIEEWTGIDLYTISGEKAEESAVVDLLNDSFMMRYVPPSNDGANPDFSWGSSGPTTELPDVEIYQNDENFSINDLTQHYMKLITEDGSVIIYLDNGKGGSDPVDYGTSTVTLIYDGLGNYITYLHITQNELDVTVN